MIATWRYLLLVALRDRLIVALILALLAVISGSMFLAASALNEQNAFGLAFAGEASRLVLALGIVTFISFQIRRLHETREIEAILARPIGRASFILACFAAYASIAFLLSLCAAGLMGLAFQAAPGGLLEWGTSLCLESFIVAAMALFAAMALESATACVMTSLGFYLLARLGATFRFIAENKTGSVGSEQADRLLRGLIEGLSVLLPRIDLFGQTRWLVYGPGGGWGLPELLVQTGIFVPLLLLATLRDLQVKRF